MAVENLPVEDAEKSAAVSSNDGSITSEMTPEDARALFKERLCFKLDLYLLTPMLFLNILSLMGRTNIGAALIQELTVDLHLDAMKAFTATTISYVMLILFEVPSNLIMKWLEAKFNFSYMRYLSLITFCLGERSLYVNIPVSVD
jgi:hypothetical protein